MTLLYCLSYSSYKVSKTLDLLLKDYPICISPVATFEDKLSLLQRTKAAVVKVIDNGISAVIPLLTHGKSWSGLVIKKQPDDSL